MVQFKLFSAFVVAVLMWSSNVTAANLSWRCTFPGFKETITFVYERGSQNGVMIGNNGTATVWVLQGRDAVSFIEPLLTGAAQLTTIMFPGGAAVHSRHTLTPFDGGKFLQSQVQGVCKAWN
jgi:hypothetical protein